MLQGKSKSLMEEADHKDIADAGWKFIEENADSHTAIQALHDKGEAALLEAIKKKNDNWLEQSGNKAESTKCTQERKQELQTDF